MVTELPTRYRVLRHVANGGMGAVYAAEDEVLGRTVAVKVLGSHLAEDPVNRERFVREARAAARLSGHPNVVQVYDVGEHENRPYMVMELMECGSLATVLRERRPEREEALAWLAQAAAALDHGHAQGVVHRDVKPANLLLDAANVVHVADFGIARIATDETLTGTGQVLGTAAYLSPEQVLGRPATEASDEYALAVVAFELLAGTRPFRGGNLAAQARQHVETEPPAATSFRAELPRGVDDVLRRGLAKDPGERWPSATAMVEALREAVREEPTAATRALAPRRPAAAAVPPPDDPPPEGPPASGGDRRRGALALAALAAIALAVVAVVALGNGGNDAKQTADRSQPKRTATQKKSPPPKKKKEQAAAPAPAPTPTQTASTPTSTTPSSSSASAMALQAAGHQKLLAGDPQGAIPLLRRAIDATGKSTDDCLTATGTCLTYAYALFDLGQALRQSGNPEAAIPVLRDRLRIDNQRGTVQAELDRAEAEASGSSSGSGSGSAGKGNGKAKGKGKG